MITSRIKALVTLGALLSYFSLPLAAQERKPSASSTRPPDMVSFRADLDAAAAIPGNSEPATGDVSGTYDRTTHVLKFRARFFDLSGPATNARFHGPAAFDRTSWAVVAAPRPDARLVEGTAWLDKEEELDLLGGRWYFNVTTQKHPQGEIRGMVHIVPSQSASR